MPDLLKLLSIKFKVVITYYEVGPYNITICQDENGEFLHLDVEETIF